MDPTPLDLEQQLQRHGGALRRLAGELVRDPAAADDAVQETWLHAARRGPRHDGQVGGWLVTILRRTVRRMQRGERRRQQREQAVARELAVADHAEVAARTEIVQQLLVAVDELDAPFRDAIWQRYFEGLPPREIAQRSGEPLTTVKSRLQRGLQQLRERLGEGEDGESHWRTALATAFGFENDVALAGAVAAWHGGLLMATWTKGMVAAALVVVAAWWWWPVQPGVGQSIARAEPTGPVAASVAATPDAEPAIERVAVPPSPPPDAPAAASPPPPATARLHGRVVAAETGAPLAGIEIYRRRGIGDVRWEPDDTLRTTGLDGRFEFEVAAGRTPGLMLRGPLRGNCYWTGSILGAGQDADIGDLPLVGGRHVVGRLVDERQQPVAAKVSIEVQALSNAFAGGVARGLTALNPQIQSDDEGRFETSGAIACGPVRWLVYQGSYELAAPQESRIEPGEGPMLVDLVVRRRPEIRGVVVDEAGQPVAGVRVMVKGDSSGSFTTAEGTFVVWRRQPADEATICVETPVSFEPATPIEHVQWDTANLRVVLRRTVPFVVEVVGPDGEPIEDFGIVIEREQLAERPGTVRQRDHHDGGTLAVEGAVRGQTTLRVLPTARTWTPSEPMSVADAEPLRVVLQPRLPCRIRVITGGQPVAEAAVELVHERQSGGRVVDPHGDRAWVPLRGRDAELVARGTTDTHGEVAMLRDATVDGRQVRIQVPGRPPHVVRDLVFPSDGSPLVVDLPSRGHISGQVELRGVPRQQVRVVLSAAGQARTPQPDGSFEFRDLPTGTYAISLARSPRERMAAVQGSERTLEITPDSVTEVRFDLGDFPTSSVHGQVVGSEPLPAGLTIEFMRHAGGALAEILGTTDVGADGSFAMADLLPGEYLLACRTDHGPKQWLPGLQAETLVLLGGERAQVRVPFQPRRLVVNFRRADGSEADGMAIRARCGGEQWPATLGILLGGGPRIDGALVLDPAPALPIEFRDRADGSPWSTPVVMPPDRAEAEVTVVLPDAPR